MVSSGQDTDLTTKLPTCERESLKKHFAPRKFSHTNVLVNLIQGTRIYPSGSQKWWCCPYENGFGNIKSLRVRMVVDSSYNVRQLLRSKCGSLGVAG